MLAEPVEVVVVAETEMIVEGMVVMIVDMEAVTVGDENPAGWESK